MAAIRTRIGWLADFPLIAPETDEPGVRALPLVRYLYRIYYEIAGEEVRPAHPSHAAATLAARTIAVDNENRTLRDRLAALPSMRIPAFQRYAEEGVSATRSCPMPGLTGITR
jgi:hypothetical protein